MEELDETLNVNNELPKSILGNYIVLSNPTFEKEKEIQEVLNMLPTEEQKANYVKEKVLSHWSKAAVLLAGSECKYIKANDFVMLDHVDVSNRAKYILDGKYLTIRESDVIAIW